MAKDALLHYSRERPIIRVTVFMESSSECIRLSDLPLSQFVAELGAEGFPGRVCLFVGNLLAGDRLTMTPWDFYFVPDPDALRDQCYDLEPGPVKQAFIRACLIEGMVQ